MGFKDIVKKDIEKVFFNPEEFGSPHQIGERTLNLIVDDNEMVEREKRAPLKDLTDGTYRRKLMFYVAAREFGPLPAVGKLLSLDGRQYRIIDAVNEDGVYSISLEAVRGI